MLYTAVKQALKAFVYPVVGRLKAVVSSPLLSASRHVGVSDWCSVKNMNQEGKGRVRRVRFASDAKKEGGVLHPFGVWLPSPTRREVGGEVCHMSMPCNYEDGNFDDWLQHHQEDLGKRASFWHNVRKKSLVEKEYIALQQQLQQKHDEFFELERKIDALDTQEVGEEEPGEVQEDELQENDSLQSEVEVPFEESVQEDAEEEPGEVQEDELQENDSLQSEVEVPFEESVQEDAEEEPGEVQEDELQENDSLQLEVEVPFEESVQEDAEEEPGEVQEDEVQENDSLQLEVEVPFEESVQEDAEEEPGEVQEDEVQENDSLQLEVEVPFEESVQEDAEEEPGEVQEDELQENDSLQLEVEKLGSGFATDAAGRVRRFSHRLKGKSRRIYKF